MAESKVSKISSEQYLLSKEAINLPPKERLSLLLKCKRYPIVRKRTSAERQLKEMIDFYDLCCLMLAQYFPNEQAENNFMMLSCMVAMNEPQIITPELSRYFKLLTDYEKLENNMCAIKSLLFEYYYIYPDLYERYNLEDIATRKIYDAIERGKHLLNYEPDLCKEILKRWGLS